MTTEAPPVLHHPLTGDPLSNDDEVLVALRETEQHVGAEVGKTYLRLRPLQDAAQLLRDHVKAVLPSARYRTDAQAKVARCPRCGTRLE